MDMNGKIIVTRLESLVLFPKWFNGDRIFLTPAWKFLIDMLDRAILQRSQSNNVSLIRILFNRREF